MKTKLLWDWSMKSCFIFSALLFLLHVNAFAQNIVSGTITDKSGTLVGVGVQVKGTKISTVTGTDGKYSIKVANAATDVLVFSYIGYATQEIAIAGKTSINVTLQDQSADLNEVVVVGYGTQRKSDLTGAISVVKAADVKKRQATTVAESLQGLATGIRVRGGGQPGSEAQIQIRGLKNLSGNNPLYVIDGLITTANRDFNPADIESIQILKDASAAAIYGSRAANGVIIITTKKGTAGPMQVSVSAKNTIQTMPRYDLAQTDEFVRINNMAYDNAGLARQTPDLSNNTNWQDVAFQTGMVQDYNVNFSGGSKDGTYFVSTGYFKNKGTVISTGFDRYNFRVNTNSTKGIFTIGENIAVSNSKSDEISGNPIVDVYRMLPTIPVYDAANASEGGYGYGKDKVATTFGTNPLAIANLEDRTNENLRLKGNVFGELKLLKSLKFRSSLGYETSRDHYIYLRKEGSWTLNQPPADPSILTENRGESTTAIIENTLTFNHKFGKHTLNAIAGQSYQKDNYAIMSGTKRNLLVNPDGGYYAVLDQGTDALLTGYKTRTNFISYFSRVEYNYDDRYLLNGVIRNDGTSRFGTAYNTGTFPSVSGAWRISKEDFFHSSWIDDLKLRANYGVLGSSNIGAYDYIAIINTFGSAVFGSDQTVQQGATQIQLANADLKWERVTQQNFGFDAAFLQNKLTVTGEYFTSKTKNVLIAYPLLLSTGNSGNSPFVNGATLGNHGFELTATYQDNSKEFKYSGTVNLTTVKNKVIDLGYGKNSTYVGNTVTEVGQPIGMWYVLQTDGIFQNAAEIANYKNAAGAVIQPTAVPGDIRYKDNNGDGLITNDDKVVVGSPWAKYELGLNLAASYKGFELTMDWFGSFGSKVYNGPRSTMDNFSDNSNYRAGIQPWTPENPNTDVPRAVIGSSLNSRGDTDRWIENGSFARMKYIGITYNLPQKYMTKLGFSSAQVTLSGQNLLTITKYTGLDPEFSNSSVWEKGYDYGAFPNLKSVSLGLQFGF